MTVKKCDRCLKEIPDKQPDKVFDIYRKLDKPYVLASDKWESVDLCMECQMKLKEWMNEDRTID